MKIKHSKFRNTGLIYELLVKQITSDLVARKDSPAISIFKKYFSEDSALVREYGLYKIVAESVNLTTIKADNLIREALKAARRIDSKELKSLKYNLISEVSKNYNLDEFFSAPVTNYKPMAAFYCLLEADRSTDFVEPESIVNNKVTLLEHMTGRLAEPEKQDKFLKEFSESESDLRALTFKVLLEKFNKKYANLLPEQKNVLKQLISIGSTRALREYINGEYSSISSTLAESIKVFPKGIEKIKLVEALKMIQPLETSDKNFDEHLVRILQYHELLNELKKA